MRIEGRREEVFGGNGKGTGMVVMWLGPEYPAYMCGKAARKPIVYN